MSPLGNGPRGASGPRTSRASSRTDAPKPTPVRSANGGQRVLRVRETLCRSIVKAETRPQALHQTACRAKSVLHRTLTLERYPLAALAIPYCTRYVLDRPITLEQPVYLPGNGHQGIWASPLLERVIGPEPKCEWTTPKKQAGGISLRGDLELLFLVFGELRRSYSELPVRWLVNLELPRGRRILGSIPAVPNRTTARQEIVISQP